MPKVRLTLNSRCAISDYFVVIYYKEIRRWSIGLKSFQKVSKITSTIGRVAVCLCC
jgi:hypothetical protein